MLKWLSAVLACVLVASASAQISDNGARVQYVASAAQTEFDYPFEITADADLNVYVDGVLQTLTTDYTVAGEGEASGGTLTFVTGLSANDVVTIVRDTAIARSTSFGQNAPLASSSINTEFDKLFTIAQELEDDLTRSLHLPETVEGVDFEIDPTTFADKYLTFNSDGEPTPAELSATTMTQSTIGALLFPRTANEITAGVTPTSYAYPSLDVRRYGAVAADGTANSDQTALDAAVDVAEVAGGTVYLPEGTWNGCITIESPRVNVAGAGMFAAILEATDCDGITLDYTAGVGGVVIRDLNVQGVTGSTRKGITVPGSLDEADEIYGIIIERTLIRGFNVGIHLRAVRDVVLTSNWIQDVDRGLELIGSNLVSHISFNKIVHAAGAGGSGDVIGVTLDAFNFTSGSGIVVDEGIQFVSNYVYGFDTGIDIGSTNTVNIIAADIQAAVYGVDFQTASLGFNLTDSYFDMVGASVVAGIYGRGLGSVPPARINIQRNTLNGTSVPVTGVGIKINDSGDQNQNFVSITDNFTTGDWDAGDIVVNNAGPTWIRDNRLTSPTPTNSISVPNVVTGPVFISGNLATKAINYVAAEAAAGELVIGPNIVSAGATPYSFPGLWTTPSFSAGNFTASGSQTWTVASGDVTTYAYEIVGNRMTVVFSIDTSTVGGTPSGGLRIAIPASKVAAKEAYNAVLVLDNSTRSIGTAHVTASATYITIQKADGGNWAAATDATYVKGQLTFEIN